MHRPSTPNWGKTGPDGGGKACRLVRWKWATERVGLDLPSGFAIATLMSRLTLLFMRTTALAAVAASAIIGRQVALAADDRYYVVPLGELRLVEGTLPAAEDGTWNRWQQRRAETLRPSAAVEGPG